MRWTRFTTLLLLLASIPACADVGPTQPDLQSAFDYGEPPPGEDGPGETMLTIDLIEATPNPAPLGSAIQMHAEISGGTVQSSEYSITPDVGEATWIELADTELMPSENGASPSWALVDVLGVGVHEVCIRATGGGGGGGPVIVSNLLTVARDEHEGPPPGEGSVTEPLCTLVVVYDPSGGFVTGGGWIHSDLGDYALDGSLEGKATFGFVSKYKKGAHAPTGNTEFQFHAAGMNFHSGSYDWLVVAGQTAQFKGSGTINGAGDYTFKLWATDASPDHLRMKIWTEDEGVENVVYDSGDSMLAKGQIVIHDK